MDKETLEALQGSIKKWEGIVDGTVEDQGTDNCPLCQKFLYAEDEDKCCVGCPVSLKTGFDMCYGSPYHRWVDSLDLCMDDSSFAVTQQQKELAQAELDFLKSLLPKKEQL